MNGKDLFAFWTANTFSSDQYSQARITGGLSNGLQYAEVLARANGSGEGIYNAYLCYTDGLAGAGHTEIAKNINGSQITFRSFPTTFAAGDIIKITAVGTTITCYKNSVAIGSVTDATLTAGSPGVGVYGNAATLDDWEGGSLTTVAADPAPVAVVTVNPNAVSEAVGASQQLSVTEKDASGNVLTGRTASWSSNNASTATVDPAGVVTGIGAGTAMITATSEGMAGTATVTVTAKPAPVASIKLTPAAATVAVGASQQLAATTLDSIGGAVFGRSIAWSSSDTTIATVNAGTGLVTAVAAGIATITATSEGTTGTATITVPAPVAAVAVSPASASIVAGATQQLSAVTSDGNNNVLAGRAIAWSSSTASVATVSATGLVTAVNAGGPVTITATSEGKTGSASITVTAARVAMVTVGPSEATIAVGGIQPLAAVTRDANNNILSGRLVSWSSDASGVAGVNPSTGVVSGVSVGSATITATSEGQVGTATVSVVPPAAGPPGPLHVSTDNPRYFADPTGRIVYLTGSHYWKNVQDDNTTNPPVPFDNVAYLNLLQSHNHNFTRLWVWEQAEWSDEVSYDHWFSPTLYVRTGPGVGADGAAKFDLNQINPAYLSRLRQRVIDAGAKGIYVSVMLFDGWSVEMKPGWTKRNPWLAHPYNKANNINGIDGDPNGDASGSETQTLTIPTVTAVQEAYVRAVIDAVNDLDNVIYEISNESNVQSNSWQYHMIDFVRSYESGKPKRHPIGMTVAWPNGTNAALTSSAADWISMNGNPSSPVIAGGDKVSLWDTDHLCGICGDVGFVWRALTRGHNPLLMDGYDNSPGVSDPSYNPNNAVWEAIRKNLGYARSYAVRMDLANAIPHGELASSNYCLAKPGSQYLVYTSGSNVALNLGAVPSNVNLTVEWFNSSTGQATVTGTVKGGANRTLQRPTSGGDVVFVH